MLYLLEIENFYSIRNRQIIDLRAAKNVPDSDRLAPIWRGSSERAPKTVAIYGANASGKSTVLRALAFISQFVAHSFSAAANSRVVLDRFNDEEALGLPCRLAVELQGLADPSTSDDLNAAECRYRYELVVAGARSEMAQVESETVFYWPPPHRKKVKLFHRDSGGNVTGAREFGLAGFRPALEKVLRPNASVISTLVQLKHPFATLIWNAATRAVGNIFIERQETNDGALVRHYAINREQLDGLNRELPRIDLGIQGAHIFSGTDGPQIQFQHEGLAMMMPLQLESQGTRSFLKIYPLIAQVLTNGGVALIDELDASIHPSILPEIVGWFHDPKRNPHGAQLFMTLHDPSLLDYLTKEEVLFCQKDRVGVTSVYKLSDIAGVRREDNFYRKYLGGVYGAIPTIG